MKADQRMGQPSSACLFVAVIDEPFWRHCGTCGEPLEQRGAVEVDHGARDTALEGMEDNLVFEHRLAHPAADPLKLRDLHHA